MNNAKYVEDGKKYVMNTYGRLPIAMVKGKGSLIWDADGNEYIDFVAGIAVNSLGHCHPAITGALKEQAETLIHCSNLYWIDKQVELAKLLVLNSACDKVFFCNSGAEANEGAIKLARKYSVMKGYSDRYEIITADKSFHGRTMATLTATGQEKVRKGFDPLLPGFKYVPYSDIAALKAAISHKTCAIMLEPIQCEGGIFVPDKEYMMAVSKICKDNDILLILDEVQTGLGRTGKIFAYENFDIEPDILTLAKALGGGAPVGAFLAKDEVANAMVPGDHGCTFGGNPLVTAAGVAYINTLINENLCDNVNKMSQLIFDRIKPFVDKYLFVKDVRGLGLIVGIECDMPVAPIIAKCLDKGLLVLSAGPNVLRMVPPINIDSDIVNKAMNILSGAVEQFAKEK